LELGDLIFYSATFYNPEDSLSKKAHDIVHVEVWTGGETGEATIGSRYGIGVCKNASYKFQGDKSEKYHSVKYHFRSIDTWLDGVCRSHCKQHPWRVKLADRWRMLPITVDKVGLSKLNAAKEPKEKRPSANGGRPDNKESVKEKALQESRKEKSKEHEEENAKEAPPHPPPPQNQPCPCTFCEAPTIKPPSSSLASTRQPQALPSAVATQRRSREQERDNTAAVARVPAPPPSSAPSARFGRRQCLGPLIPKNPNVKLSAEPLLARPGPDQGKPPAATPAPGGRRVMVQNYGVTLLEAPESLSHPRRALEVAPSRGGVKEGNEKGRGNTHREATREALRGGFAARKRSGSLSARGNLNHHATFVPFFDNPGQARGSQGDASGQMVHRDTKPPPGPQRMATAPSKCAAGGGGRPAGRRAGCA